MIGSGWGGVKYKINRTKQPRYQNVGGFAELTRKEKKKKKKNGDQSNKTSLELTTSFTDTGAFNASTISPALADPALDRILLNWSDIEPDLECEPRELSENPEESWPAVIRGLLLPVE